MFLAKLSRNYRVLYFSPTPPVHGLRHGTRPVLQWDIYCGGWASLDTSLSPEVEQPTSGLALDVACSWTRVSAIPVSRPSLSFSNPWCLRVPVVLRCPHCHTVRVIWSRFFRLAFFFRKKRIMWKAKLQSKSSSICWSFSRWPGSGQCQKPPRLVASPSLCAIIAVSHARSVNRELGWKWSSQNLSQHSFGMLTSQTVT